MIEFSGLDLFFSFFYWIIIDNKKKFYSRYDQQIIFCELNLSEQKTRKEVEFFCIFEGNVYSFL